MSSKSILRETIAKALGYPSLIRRIQAPVVLKMLNLQRADVVLDAGCGSGYFTSEIAQKSCLVIGIDLKLKKTLALALGKQSNKTFATASVEEMPFIENKFDKVLLSSVLQMVNDRPLLEECFRVLKHDGQLVLSVPIEFCYIKELNQIKPQLGAKAEAKGKAYYTIQELTEVLKQAGFEILEVEFSPKKFGSLVCEMEMYLWNRLGLPFFSSFVFPLFYLLLYFEHKAKKNQRGNELIIKAQKKGSG